MSETTTAIVEGAVVILAIVMGVRLGGIGLGLWGAAGTAILIFAFNDTPGEPPISAFFIIIAVITASAAMQAAGGIDWLVGIAGKIIRRNPSRITYVAPIVTFLFTMGAGTGNIYLSLIPVIYATSYEAKVRPERPLSVSTIASGLGLTASPVAAAMAAMLALVTAKNANFTLSNILMITIPAGLAGTIVASFVMSHRGKDLADDEEYQRRLTEGKISPPAPLEDKQLPPEAKLSAIIFLVGVAFIVLAGLFPALRPNVIPTEEKGVFDPLGMNETIQLTMFVVALIIVMWTHIKPGDVAKQPLISSGLVAAIALFGLAWMTATYLDANPIVITSIGGHRHGAPAVPGGRPVPGVRIDDESVGHDERDRADRSGGAARYRPSSGCGPRWSAASCSRPTAPSSPPSRSTRRGRPVSPTTRWSTRSPSRS